MGSISGVVQCFRNDGESDGLQKMSLMYCQISSNNGIKVDSKKLPHLMPSVMHKL